MRGLATDVGYALRLLRRTPAFTSVAVLVLALGIGSSTAIYSVVDSILFRPLDLPDSERVYALCETGPKALEGWCGVSPTNATDWAERAESFSAIGVARSRVFSMGTAGGAELVQGGIATPGYFRAMGWSPLRGRLFDADDGPPSGVGRTAIVTHEFWQTRLGGAGDVPGRILRLDDQPYTVVGVLPPGSEPVRLPAVDLWVPLPFDPAAPENRGWRGFVGAGRLADGVQPERAVAELAAIQRALGDLHPETVAGWGVDAVRLRHQVGRSTRPMLLVFLAAVAAVLLIVCVNMAGLLLARASLREREMVVRKALGASRGRVARQVVTEAAVLGVLGGLGGVLLAVWATDVFVAMAPPGIPRLDEVGVDGRVLTFAALISLASGLLFGLAPALRSGRMEPAQVLREGRSRSGTRSTLHARRVLVVAELALTVVVVTGAGLLLRSFTGLLDWDPGFDTGHLLTFQVFASPGYPEAGDVVLLYRELEEALAAMPGARAASSVSAGPLFGGGDGETALLVEGRDQDVDAATRAAWFNVGPGYFATLGVPLRAGRPFHESDDADAPLAALINETLAERVWPEADPVGARVTLPELDSLTVEVIGVMADVAPFHRGRPPAPELYFSNRQLTRWAAYMVVRTEREPLALADAATAVVARTDPNIRPTSMGTMEQHVASALVRPRFNALLVSLFAVIALVLGAVGLYGLVAYLVATRAREIGIRMAMGAGRPDILRQVMSEGFRLVALGLAVGGVAAGLSARLIQGLLYGVLPTDPFALGGTVMVLGASGLLASLIPALRATRMDPAETLRRD